MAEMGSHIGQDVRSKLNGMCEMLRVDIDGQLANSQGKQQELEQRLRNVANAVDGRLLENNNRNNHQKFCWKR